jgi:hypothetical protein
LSLRVAGVIFILASVLLPFASSQSSNQPTTQGDINGSQKASDQLLGFKLVEGERGSYYSISSKYTEASNEGDVANKKEAGSTNATELMINATAAKEDIIIPTKNKFESHVFYINSAKELRTNINNTTYIKKIFLLRSGKYDGPFYICNNTGHIIIMPDPIIKGSVILDAKNADFNFALDNASNVSFLLKA